MANEKISELPAGGPAQASDAVPIARAGSNFQLAVSNFTAGPTGPTGPTGPGGAAGSGIAATFGGNTSGTLALISTGTMALFGGNNLTLSQVGQSVTLSAFNQSVQTQASGNIGGTGFATTTSAGSVIAGTNNTAGFTLGVPAFLTAQSVQTQASGSIAGIGVTTTTQGGSTLGATQNTAGLSLALPAWVTAGGGGGGIDVTLGGNTSGALALVSSGTLFLAGGNNVTLSQNGQSVTISGANAGGAQTGISSIAVSNATYTSGAVTFSNANGITFGSSAGQAITASYNSTQFAGTGTSATNASVTLNSNGLAISVGAGGGASTGGAYIAGNTTGQSSSSTFPISSFNISAAGLITAGWSSNSLIISAPATTGISQSLYATGNTTLTSSGTASIGSLLVSGAGNVTVGVSSGTLVISGAGSGGGAANSIGGNSTSAGAGYSNITSGTAFLLGGNNITLSQNGASITFSAANQSNQTAASGNIAGTGFATTTIAGSTVGGTLNTAGMTLAVPAFLTTQSVQTQASGAIAGTGTSATNASITLNSAGLAISVGAGGGASTAGLFATGNTTNGSTTTVALSSQLYNFQGGVTGGFSNGSIQVSAPALSSISVSGNLSLSVNASTISIGGIGAGTGFTTGSTTGVVGAVTINTAGISSQDAYLTRYVHPPSAQLTAITAPGNASMTVQYVPIPSPLTGTRMDALVAISAGSTTTVATAGIALSAYGIIYTKNGSTLSSLSSGSTQTTYTYASNTGGATWLTQSAIYGMSVPINFNMAPGEYYVGFNLLTNTTSIGLTTTNLGLTLSMMGGNDLQTAINYAELGANTATSSNLYNIGVYSAATTGAVTRVSLSAINQTGTAMSAGNIALVFRNA